MSMGINFKLTGDPSARSAYNSICKTNRAIEKTIGVLSSKFRINSAADDAAGLAMSERMRAEIAGLDKALSNVQDGVSLLHTAEGGLFSVNAILQRMRELAVQSASDTLTQSDRAAIQSEFGDIRDEIDRIADTTQFNRKKLLNGSTSALWSSTDPNVRVILNGSINNLDQFGNKISAEGNYDISISAKAGQSEVQKTSLFTLLNDYPIDSYYGLVGTGLYYDTDGNEITTEEAVRNFVPSSWGTDGIVYSFKITDADNSSNVVNVRATIHAGDFSTPKDFVDYLNSEASVDGDTTLYGTDYEAFYNESIGKLGIRSSHNFTVDDSAEGYQKLFGTFKNQDIPSSSNTTIYVPASAVTSSAPLLRSGGMRLFSAPLLGATPDTLTSGVTTLENESKTSLTIASGANVTLRLVGTSNIGNITLGANSSLTIEGDGTLNALLDAGDSGTITINSGTINAIASNSNTAGIRIAKSSTLNINGGTVTAKGGQDAAGIGGIREPGSADGTITYNGGTININGGTVEATGGNYGAGIGSGRYMVNGTINITGGDITATSPSWGAGIGGGSAGMGGEINISGGTIKALNTGQAGAGIGSGSKAAGENITISGGYIEASGGNEAAGIGSGRYANAGSITITGGTIKAKGGPSGSGIGSGSGSERDGTVSVGDSARTGKGTITISGGEITAEGGSNGAGIGGGLQAPGNTISITGGYITATAGTTGNAAAIGGGNNAPTQSTDANGEATGITNISIQEGLYENGFIRAASIGLSSADTGDNVAFTTISNEVLIDSGYIEESVAAGSMATGNFMLSELANFYDEGGKFLLDVPQKLTIIQGDGQTASIMFYGNDTLNDVVQKLNSAISEELGQSKYLTDGSGNHFASLVTEDNAAENTSESVAGSIVIRSAIAGSEGRLRFSGAEELLNSLGVNTIQEATESEFEINITNSHNNSNVALNIKTTGNHLIGAISPDADIVFDAMAGIHADWNDTAKKFMFSAQNATTTVHLKDNSVRLQAGINEGEVIDFGIGEISSDSLNLKKVDVVSRERAAEAIGVIDTALDKVSSQNAKVGVLINRLEHSASVISVMHENVTSSESRIRDADEAKAAADFTKLQIMLNAQTSVFAQANQQPENVLSLIRD